MQVADYRQASLTDVDFAFAVAEATKQRAGWMAGPQKAQCGASTLAIRDAAPAGGTFPVVIYAPSFAAFAHENLDLCEYLANHADPPSMGPRWPLQIPPPLAGSNSSRQDSWIVG
jgi:hypothetical protein